MTRSQHIFFFLAVFLPPIYSFQEHRIPRSLTILRSAIDKENEKTSVSDSYLKDFFQSECNDKLLPPSLSVILKSIQALASGSDIRGRFVDHPRVGNPVAVGRAIKNDPSSLPALTPFAAHCLGYGFATMLKRECPEVVVCVGRDPRKHGARLADAFGRGVEDVQGVRVVYTGIATTPSMFDFCRSGLCDGGVMVTASHLPGDRNGLKFFTAKGGFTKNQVLEMIDLATSYAQRWYDMALIPPSSGSDGVFCSEWVNWMPKYEDGLKKALLKEVNCVENKAERPRETTLSGLKIVLNAGNGSGGFFEKVLSDLGADMTASIHTNPDGNFPAGIPNPESKSMIEETIEQCQKSEADIGILLDTDADRCGVVLKSKNGYEALVGNRLIALMGVIMARQSPGCAIVTDSVTSIGLSSFLENHLGLTHVRHVRGYANVIQKARYLTENGIANAEVAIETSGHCALKENDYLDDGTYTAVKVVGLLARERATKPDVSLLDLIADLPEVDVVSETRLKLLDGDLGKLSRIFDLISFKIEKTCQERDDWSIDEGNQEGIRVITGEEGGYFMIRKSLHDPVLSLQIEAATTESGNSMVVEPLQSILGSKAEFSSLDLSALKRLE